jgi:mannose-6-phosphate isomerase-like protein (cupin superfamily)
MIFLPDVFEFTPKLRKGVINMGSRIKSENHVMADQIAWTSASHYPEALQRVVRWKTLIGNPGPEWHGVPQKDVLMGVLELDTGGYYPSHAHPAPEIYFVLSGTADWTVDHETFVVEPGMAIYHAPNVPHRMVNKGTQPLRAVWFWWAPDGRSEVFQGEIKLLEPISETL